MYYIYILYSAGSDKYYVGYTADYNRRQTEHNTQEHFDTYTSKHRPWQLAAVFEAGHDEGEAVKLERFIKQQKSRSFIQRLCDPDFTPDGRLAQLVRVPKLRD